MLKPLAKIYEKWVFPRVMDTLLDRDQFAIFRSQLLEKVTGEVLEIGFGSGLNLVHYPKQVTRLFAVDSNPGMNHLAHDRLSDVLFPVEYHTLQAEGLPWGEGSFDFVVSTWTLCSVKDIDRVLKEVHRVLKPGAKFLFLEHGLSIDKKIQKWQHRLKWVNQTLGGGCDLTREIKTHLKVAGFSHLEFREFYVEKIPKSHGFMCFGSATK